MRDAQHRPAGPTSNKWNKTKRGGESIRGLVNENMMTEKKQRSSKLGAFNEQMFCINDLRRSSIWQLDFCLGR
jgi:hypothetical protein